MKLSRSLWLIPVVILLLSSLAIGGSITLGSVANENSVFEIFYGVSPKLNTELEQVVLADSRVQDLIKGREHTIVADGHIIEDKDYNLNVGVRLKDGITLEQFREWVKGGRQDCDLVQEYTGILNVGYNDKYYITIDTDKSKIVEIRDKEGYRQIPEVTAEEKQRAVEIALADPTVQRIISGKSYQIAPDGKIGVWHVGDTKLGVAFQVDFDQPYSIDTTLPKYNSEAQYIIGEVEGVIIDVLLEENRVATIIPRSLIVEN